MTAITPRKRPQQETAIAPQREVTAIQGVEWTPEQIQIVKDQLVSRANAQDPGPSDAELAYYFSVCKATELSPFKKQIYAIRRWDKTLGAVKTVIQVGIGGLRAIAARTGEYAGSEEPLYDEDLTTFEMKREGRSRPVCAKVTVYRLVRGVRCPFVGVALYDEFKQLSPVWTSMGFNQLAKCAEAQALSKAFPEETAGLEVSDDDIPGGEFRGDRTPVDYLDSDTWYQFTTDIKRATTPERVEMICNAMRDKIGRGELPQVARNGIDREMSRAIDRLANSFPGKSPGQVLLEKIQEKLSGDVSLDNLKAIVRWMEAPNQARVFAEDAIARQLAKDLIEQKTRELEVKEVEAIEVEVEAETDGIDS